MLKRMFPEHFIMMKKFKKKSGKNNKKFKFLIAKKIHPRSYFNFFQKNI